MTEQEHRAILNTIVTTIVKNKWLITELNKMSSDSMLMDDLCQDLCIAILEYPNNKMVEAYTKGEHLYLIKRMIKNQFNSNNSAFYYTYRKNQTEDLDTYLWKEEGGLEERGYDND